MSTRKQLPSCHPKTAVAYARYSSAQQRDVSIEQQLRDIRAYAEREGYTIIYEYADRAKSGFKNADRRAEFQAMLRAASSGAFDTVLAWKVDRFGRNRRESAMYKGQLADQGVSVVYAMEPIPDGAAGVLTEGMLEAIAEWYSRNLSENVKRGLYDNARKCNANGNKLFGYSIDQTGHYVINEAEASLVRYIFTLYSQGYSFHALERRLMDEGVRTPRGAYYCKATLMYMIANESYIGTFHYDNIRVPGGMPAIIDRELWDACQSIRQKTTRKHEKSGVLYLLSGKCYCGRCNARMTGCYSTSSKRSNKRNYYYACSAGKSKYTCKMPYKRKELLESKVYDYLFNNVLNGKLLDRFTDAVIESLSEYKRDAAGKDIEKELQTVNKKIENINQAISEGIWTKQTAEMLNSLSARAEELEIMINSQKLDENRSISKDRIRFYLRKIADGKRDDQDYLRSLALTFINSVTVYDDWIRIVLNAAEGIPKISPEELPPLENLPDGKTIDFCSTHSSELVTVACYPVIVFKIAI